MAALAAVDAPLSGLPQPATKLLLQVTDGKLCLFEGISPVHNEKELNQGRANQPVWTSATPSNQRR